MSDFRARQGDNVGGPVVTEGDFSRSLFSPGYVFGVPELPIEDEPAFADIPDIPPQGDTSPLWMAAPPSDEPSPIASTQQTGADSKWVLWPSLQSYATVALPDGSDIRSLWIPVVPVQIQISIGFAGGSILYPVTTQGGEIIPIPKGTKVLTLTASALAYKPDIYVYATADIFPPTKTGINGAPLPIAGQNSPYDSLILATPALEYYWPLNDPSGSLSAQQLGPVAGNAGTPSGGVSFGSSSLLTDGSTSAFFNDGAQNTEIKLGTAEPGGGTQPLTLEFWWAYSNFDSGTGSAQDNLLGNDPAGPMIIGLTKTNGELYVSGAGSIAISPASGKAHYFVLTVDSSSVWTVWHDGAIVAQSGSGAAWANMGGTWWAGARGATGTPGVIGNIAKVAFYGRVLSAGEIAQRWGYKIA